MNLIALKDLRLKIDKYAKLVNKSGESYLVTRKGKPLFRLAPIEDDKRWETLIDFTEVDPKGIPIDKVIAALEKQTR